MAYRIHADDSDGKSILSFHGDLDQAALGDLKRRVLERAEKGRSVQVILRTGTNVEPGIVDELVRMRGASLETESSFLKYWIERARNQNGKERP